MIHYEIGHEIIVTPKFDDEHKIQIEGRSVVNIFMHGLAVNPQSGNKTPIFEFATSFDLDDGDNIENANKMISTLSADVIKEFSDRVERAAEAARQAALARFGANNTNAQGG